MQNEQQGRGTVEWVKGVLIERGNILMTMPSLPAQLATLSNLLATRMELYQPLLSLSGRLDLALAQINVRRLAAEQASLPTPRVTASTMSRARATTRWPLRLATRTRTTLRTLT
jgi:hypothetical protein